MSGRTHVAIAGALFKDFAVRSANHDVDLHIRSKGTGAKILACQPGNQNCAGLIFAGMTDDDIYRRSAP